MAGFVLEDATLGKLDDDRESWGRVTECYLNGLTYAALGPHMSARDRLKWLGRGRTLPDRDERGRALPSFDPQPYSQLAKVWDAAGRRFWAARALYEREKRLRRVLWQRACDRSRRSGNARDFFHRFVADLRHGVFDPFFRAAFGYGYLPMRALVTMGLIIVASAWLCDTAWDKGEMAPMAAPVLVSDDWFQAVQEGCPLPEDPGHEAAKAAGCLMPLHLWTGAHGGEPMPSARDYESFNAWIYAADVFVPLVGLGQEAAWGPSRDRGFSGCLGFHVHWILQVLGWIITALGAAVLTGLVGRRD